MSDELPSKRYNFSPEEFPITFEALHPRTKRVVWKATVEKPEDTSALYIPPLSKELGHRVIMRITFGDGKVQEGT